MEVLFIKFNYIDMLNQYLTNIVMLNNNLNNIIFNLKGEGSTYLKRDLANLNTELNILYKKLCMLIKKIGGFPITSLNEIKNISTIKEITSKDYTSQNAINILLNDLRIINNMNNQVGEYAIKNYDLRSINLTLELNTFFNNYLYMLNNY